MYIEISTTLSNLYHTSRRVVLYCNSIQYKNKNKKNTFLLPTKSTILVRGKAMYMYSYTYWTADMKMPHRCDIVTLLACLLVDTNTKSSRIAIMIMITITIQVEHTKLVKKVRARSSSLFCSPTTTTTRNEKKKHQAILARKYTKQCVVH